MEKKNEDARPISLLRSGAVRVSPLPPSPASSNALKLGSSRTSRADLPLPPHRTGWGEQPLSNYFAGAVYGFKKLSILTPGSSDTGNTSPVGLLRDFWVCVSFGFPVRCMQCRQKLLTQHHTSCIHGIDASMRFSRKESDKNHQKIALF